MHNDIIKLCADSLRVFTKDNYGIKLKASHAHELVAAIFGYKSKNAMLADVKYPLSNISQANIIVLGPTAPIDQRRKELQGLSDDLPDTYTLAEGAYLALIEEKVLRKPWQTYEHLAIFLADEYLRQQNMDKVYKRAVREGVEVERRCDSVLLTVSRFYQIPRNEGGVEEVYLSIYINLPRIACHIGYANPKISMSTKNLGVLR